MSHPVDPQLPGAERIAVIGMAGRFPGADDVDEFWSNLAGGVEAFTSFDDDDLLAAGVDPAQLADPRYVRVRPVLRDVRSFDAEFFGYSPREAVLTDPQHRLFLETSWQALESAGYASPEDRGQVGVFAGCNVSTYLLSRPNVMSLGVDTDALMIGNDKDALATGVAYRLDLRGPAVAVQTFCSTSLVAVHLASEALRQGDCDLALAGGVSIRVPDRVGHLYQEGNQASPDGHVRTFDALGRGSMFGDGVAVVALKRLNRALADRDTVLAVLRGSAINNDGGVKFSYQAPSIDGQRRCVARALDRSGVRPEEISYVEAHGTATVVGDPMEVAALTDAFGSTAQRQFCVLGSVKPNVGHLDRASGATGLIKVVQSLRHEMIPGTLHFTAPNPDIDFAASPFRVTSGPTSWPRTPGRPRRAGLSSLGTGGTNAHAVVEEAPLPAPRPPRRRRWQVLPVSARTEQAREQAAGRLAAALQRDVDLDLGDVAYTLQQGRRSMAHRTVVVAETGTGAAAALSGPRPSRHETTVGRPVGLLIAGVGEQYPGMVAALMTDEPDYRRDVLECVGLLGLPSPEALSPIFATATADPVDDELARLLGRAPTRPAATDPALVQPAVFVAEYALARLLQRWGVQPEVMLGYSLGEYVAACLSGVLSLPDALALVAHRARLIAALPSGAMLAVAADDRRIHAVLGSLEDRELDVAVHTPGQLTLAGTLPAVAAAAAALTAAGIGCRQLDTASAFHSRLLAPAAAPLTAWVAEHITVHPPRIPYVSNVTGGVVTPELLADPGYWARHMCGTVEFGRGASTLLAAVPDAMLVEVGPGQSLGALTRSHPDCAQARWPLVTGTLPSAMERRDPHQALAETVGRLWLSGVPVDFKALHTEGSDGPHWTPGRVPLPTYPFQRQEYWLEAPEGPAPAAAGAATGIDLSDPTAVLTALPKLPDAEWISTPTWRSEVLRPPSAAPATWLVHTAAGAGDALAEPLLRRLRAEGSTVLTLRPGPGFAITADGFEVRPGDPADIAAALRVVVDRGLRPDRMLHLWSLSDGSTARGLFAVTAFARAAGDLGLDGWIMDLVVQGAHAVLPGDRVDPAGALLTGPARLVPVEYPRCRTRLIDLGPDLHPDVLAAELLSPPTDQVVALRGRRRWLPGHSVVPDTTVVAPGFRQGGVYLITGGLGGIGLAMAIRLARDVRARLVLMGRTPVPAEHERAAVLAAPGTPAEVRRRLLGLQELADLGAAVLTVTGDVSEPEDVRRAVRLAESSFGPLDGVLHCAGVPALGLMQFKTAADMERVLAPKVAGTRALLAALADRPPSFLVLFSSTTSITGGGAGQVDYCAANAYLDAVAQSDPLPGTVVVSVGWGEWTWNGWTVGLDGYDEGSRQFFEAYRAQFGVDFEQGWQILGRVLASGERHVHVSTQDLPTLVAMSRLSSIERHQGAVRKARDALGRHPRPPLGTPYQAPATPDQEALAGLWSEALGIEEIGVDDNFFELGGNSLIGMEIIAGVREQLGVPFLPPHILYQAPTVALLAAEAAASRAAVPATAGTGDIAGPPAGAGPGHGPEPRHAAGAAASPAATASGEGNRYLQRRRTLGGGRG
ncbi:SDR family NAD(P)-dependent oxidoreductase [Nakamurella sp. YIM 132087]|uniref:SDR family NAD(P)-dependent oxidoreductase n=1 Tax=Nakamurella alba TaxID=2665158 RepID=A0A7K1FMF7_9ACTN|nr:type I polyketide synthase [Nakamurella alba]MTD15345.1 SDR family NAD(P)-dependent oxidoreductase [Nakamurella alba]